MKIRSFILLGLIVVLSFSMKAQTQVMTYNIKYANENDGENSWSKRKDWITNQIRFYEPDVLGVQEAVKNQLDHFTENMEHYAVIGEAREGGDKGEYSAILYKRNKFEVLDKNTFCI